MKKFVLFFVLLALCGCATINITKPGRITDVSLAEIAAYSGSMSIQLINNQPDDSVITFNTVKLNMGDIITKGSMRQWTQGFIDKLSGELQKRGVKVSADSPNILLVKISDFGPEIKDMAHFTSEAQARILVELKGSDYKKEWVQKDVSGWKYPRALENVLWQGIKKLLSDKDFLAKLAVKEQ